MIYFSVDYTGVKEAYKEMDCMEALMKKFQNETGIVMSVLPTMEAEAINKLLSGENANTQESMIFNEEVLWRYMSEEEKIRKLLEYIEKIDGIGREMIIVDPYIFPKKYDGEYENLIIKTIRKAKLKELTIVTDEKNVNVLLRENVKKQVDCKIEIKYSEDFHDRFWISRDAAKCFVVGTSLNGMGKKICIIELLTDENDKNDIKEIIQKIDEI